MRTLRSALPLLFGYTAFVLFTGTVEALLEDWRVVDGWWWAAVTTTTTGYGDLSPVTGAGRLVAFVTMLGGIYSIALVVANVVSTRDRWSHEEQRRLFRILGRVVARLRELERRD